MGAARSHDCGGVVPCRINSNVAQGQRRRPDLALKSVGTAKGGPPSCSVQSRNVTAARKRPVFFPELRADDFASSGISLFPPEPHRTSFASIMPACLKTSMLR